MDETDAGLVQVGVLFRQSQRLFVKIDTHHFLSLSQRPGVHGEAAGIAAQVEDTLARAETRQQLSIVALVEKEAGLVLAAGGDAEADAMFGDHGRRRRLGLPAIE